MALTRRAARGEVAAGETVAIMVKRPAHRGEGELVPGDLVPGEEPHLEALRPGGEFRRFRGNVSVTLNAPVIPVTPTFPI